MASTTIHPSVASLYAGTDTGSMKGLIEASWKLGYDKSHGKFYAWIDSSSSFFQTALFGPVRLVTHVGLLGLSLMGTLFQSGRRFFVENLVRCVIDLSAIGIGLIGSIYPWAGLSATGNLIAFCNRYVMKNDAIAEKEFKGKVFESPVYLVKYIYAYMQRSHMLMAESFGGENKLAKAAKA